MPDKEDKDKELKPQPGQSLEDFIASLKTTLRERDEALASERDEKKRKGDENSDLRKKLRAAEEEKRELSDRQRAENQKSLEEQGRYKDLWQESERRKKEAEERNAQLDKLLAEMKMAVDERDSRLTRFEKREAERVEARFAKLPEEARKQYAEQPTTVKEVIADMFERHVLQRPPGGPPPSPLGLPPAGTLVREEDVEAMSEKEYREFEKAGGIGKAIREGRFVRKGQNNPR